jgi:hypothetical protein
MYPLSEPNIISASHHLFLFTSFHHMCRMSGWPDSGYGKYCLVQVLWCSERHILPSSSGQ